MHFNMVYTRNKTLSKAEIVAALFLVLLKVINSSNISWHSTNMTVTRSLVSSDYFDIWNDKDTNDCSFNIIPNVCQSYGATSEVKSNCKMSCCKRCMCERNRPTFLVQKRKCIEDSNITQLSGSYTLLFHPSTGTSCKNGSVLPTFDLNIPGNRTFLICSNGEEFVYAGVESCALLPDEHRVIDPLKGQNDLPIDVKNSFQVSKKMLLFKWNGSSMTSLQASIVSIAVKCVLMLSPGLRPSKATITSKLYFKIAGSHTSSWPPVFYDIFKTPKPTNPPTTFTTPTTTIWTEYRSKLNVVHVPGKVDMLLVIVAAVLGSLLFLVIAAAIIIIFVFRHKQKLNISGGKHTSNPTYERGPDQSLMPNGHQTSSFKSHFYQPLVENTKVSSRAEPVYESLDDNLRDSKMSLTENPNRCSLAYCDVTSDGYLIPATGPVPFPTVTEAPPIPDKATRPRLSSSYDEPEVILKDRKPKLAVDLSSTDEKPKPFYHELEENSEVKSDQQDNEAVNRFGKSPTENTYLELIGGAKAPLESEIL